jgi:hypothetical protein
MWQKVPAQFVNVKVFLRGSLKDGAALLETELERHQAGGGCGDSTPPGTITEDQGPPDLPQADVWSLGMILAGLLLDIPLFWPQAKIAQILRWDILPNPGWERVCEIKGTVQENLTKNMSETEEYT